MAKVGRLVKESIAQELGTTLTERPNFFVTTVTRLTATDADTFRQKLHISKARLLLVKQRVGKRVITPLNIAGLPELLEGSVGLVLAGEDIPSAAKILMEFRKTHEDQLVIRGGVVDGRLLDRTRVQELADLPPKPVLLALVVATLESPIADVIFTIERLIGDLAWLAEQAATTKPAESIPEPAAGQQPPPPEPSQPSPAQAA